MLKPLQENIILKPIEAKSKTGIELPKEYNRRNNIAEVVAVSEDGKLFGKVKPGDKVVFMRGLATEIEEEFIVPETAILSIYE